MEVDQVSEEDPLLENKKPRDPYNFVAITIFMFGIACLLPWNFFITASTYWMYKFRNVTNDNHPSPNSTLTPLQESFNSDLSIASKVPYIIFLIVNTAVSHRVPLNHRVQWPIVGCIALFAATTILATVNTDHDQMTFLVVTLALVVVINVLCGFLQGAATGLTACLPGKYMAVNVLGQASGGVFATLCQLLCALIGSSPVSSAVFYFSIATLLLCLTLVCFIVMCRLDFYKFYMSQHVPQIGNIPYAQIILQGWKFYTCILLVFWVTISVFPSITVLVVSSDASNGSRVTNDLFITLACFVVFNFCDLFGRILAKWLPIPPARGSLLLAVCLSRIIFIPLIVMCNIPRDPSMSHVTSVVFGQDWEYVVIMIFFALSNGYVITLSMIYASKSVSTEYEEISGSLAALFLGLSLALGSLSSALTLKLL